MDSVTHQAAQLSLEGAPGSEDKRLDNVPLSAAVLAFAASQNISEEKLRTAVLQKPARLDESQLLSSYFISSSHNTYLAHGQLSGLASADRYRDLVKAGVRCLEIDSWDSPEEAESVKVTHGFTFTSRIPFGKVCQAIADADLEDGNSKPIIISLECHCKDEGQAYMTKKMKEVFGDRLLDSKIQNRDRITLQDAANKIMVKVEYCSKITEAVTQSDSDDSSDDEETKALRSQRREKSRIIDELSKLGVYTTSLKPKKDDFLVKEPLRASNLVANISESALHSLIPSRRADIIEHTKNYAMRVYPKGLRVMSRNLDPLPFWSAGAQIVALNFQTFDFGVQLNSALFYGSDGWVLKPDALLSGSDKPTLDRTRRLKVEIYGASGLKPPKDAAKGIHPYLGIQLCQSKSEQKYTNVVKPDVENSNGTNPVWDASIDFDYLDEPLAFLRLVLYDSLRKLTFDRFELWHKDGFFSRDDLFALAPVYLNAVQFNEWSLLRLVDVSGSPIESTLLVRLSVD